MRLFTDLKGELRGWDIKSVAIEAEVAPATIYFWLCGKTKKPRLDTVARVANAIGFDLQLVRKKVQLRRVV